MKIREVFDRNRFVLLDGAMGTQLQLRGLQPGQKPELAALYNAGCFNCHPPDYANAGADILLANTFGANPRKLRGRLHRGGGRFRFHRLCAQGRRDNRRVCGVGYRPSG